jgi:predicted nucleotidyltransferase
MGTNKETKRALPGKDTGSTSLGNALFTTTQQRTLGYLFGQPTRSFFANELINLTGSGSGAVQRELKRLAESGLVTVRQIGNQKHFQANPAAPIFTELCSIVQKTFGLALPLREVLAPLDDQIQAAFVYGSLAKQRDTAGSDVDIMIISDSLSYADVMAALAELEQRIRRQVNPTIYSAEELATRLQENNAFVTRVMAQPKIWLKGKEHDLPA